MASSSIKTAASSSTSTVQLPADPPKPYVSTAAKAKLWKFSLPAIFTVQNSELVMASFSIEELLGLGKENSSSSKREDSISELAAAKNGKDGAESKPRAARGPPALVRAVGAEPEGVEHDVVDVETLDEDSVQCHPEPVAVVTVRRRTVHTTSPGPSPPASLISPQRASRKRKRSKQADEETPAISDGKPPKLNLTLT